MRCSVVALAGALAMAGCKKQNGDDRAPAPAPTEPSSLAESLLDLEEPPPEPAPTQEPLAADPLELTTGVGGVLELDSDALPAVRRDGARIARIDRSFVGDHDQRRLSLQILDSRGQKVDEVVILDPGGDARAAGGLLEKRVDRANRLLAGGDWISMIVPELVVPDGWIRCRDGAQRFEVAGLVVEYDEPRLRVGPSSAVAPNLSLDRQLEGWRARPKQPGCEARGFISDAALDLEHQLLLVEIQYCGECGVEPKQAVVKLAAGAH